MVTFLSGLRWRQRAHTSDPSPAPRAPGAFSKEDIPAPLGVTRGHPQKTLSQRRSPRWCPEVGVHRVPGQAVLGESTGKGVPLLTCRVAPPKSLCFRTSVSPTAPTLQGHTARTREGFRDQKLSYASAASYHPREHKALALLHPVSRHLAQGLTPGRGSVNAC